MNTKQMLERRGALMARADALLKLMETEERPLTENERTEWARLMDEVDSLDEVLQRDRPNRLPFAGLQNPDAALQSRRDELAAETLTHATAIQAWMRCQAGHEVTDEQRQAAVATGIRPERRYLDLQLLGNEQFHSLRGRMLPHIHRRDSVLTTTASETIPEGFVARLEEAMLAFGGMLQVAEILRTDSGNDLPWPTMNDTTNEGEILAEQQDFGASVRPAFDRIVLGAYKFSSKPLLFSTEILEDSAFNFAAMAPRWLGERLGRVLNRKFTVGTGVDEPRGITLDSVEGVEAAAVDAFTPDDLFRLEHSVDPAYRGMNPQWMLHDDTLLAIRTFKEDGATGQYLFQPGLQAGVPGTLLARQYVINQHLPSTFEAGANLILFGPLDKYKVRWVREIRLRRLDELFAKTDEVAFIAYIRADGRLLDAGTNPVKHLSLAPA